MPCLFYDSPIGPMTLVQEGEALARLDFDVPSQPEEATPLLLEACRQLREYFAGERKAFALPLAPAGTEFQKKVWAALRDIPWGETRSYGDIARAIGKPTACRAVGMANGRNPLPIFIPCHRVIGTNGSITGYSGGLEKKRFLLRLEGISQWKENRSGKSLAE
ncbi:MAG TPA: methylated-DNA--[protein]-cysteine S-methyltransferase [Firmicutes bacterium]|nr:methylated-DNA--[protein]-cysteine S-methyltransferase [Bacillota bacterium]